MTGFQEANSVALYTDTQTLQRIVLTKETPLSKALKISGQQTQPKPFRPYVARTDDSPYEHGQIIQPSHRWWEVSS